MATIPDHDQDDDGGWFYRYFKHARPLAEQESPQDLCVNLDAIQATARWWVMLQVVNVQSAFAGFDAKSPLSDRYSQCIDLWGEAMRLPWPVHYRGRLLGMVIRQWVEEDAPSMTVARQLATAKEWQDFLGYARKTGQYRLPPQLRDATRLDMRDFAELEYSVSLRLERAGLPSNPAAARHFLATVEGRSEPLPARGILVTTLGYVTSPHDNRTTPPSTGFFSPPHETIISGIAEWMPGPLLARVNKIVRAHHRLLDEHASAPYVPTTKETSYRARRATQDAQIEPLSLDYIQHAVETFDLALVPHLSIDDSRFLAHCNTVYRRIHKRIVAHNRRNPDQAPIPTSPPVDWHQSVFHLLTQ